MHKLFILCLISKAKTIVIMTALQSNENHPSESKAKHLKDM